MESGLQGVTIGGGPGLLVGGTDGIWQSGCSMCFAGQKSAITAQSSTS